MSKINSLHPVEKQEDETDGSGQKKKKSGSLKRAWNPTFLEELKNIVYLYHLHYSFKIKCKSLQPLVSLSEGFDFLHIYKNLF